ncbi:PA0069 family radical SAM protein [Anaeromyxobacter sp. Red801]|uniref:PA0069 family radical SAM protein n=1 Tax=Anaeromyxobacter sp. Red801 TaxID=3411632 RepID=UPI003BA0F355
MKPRAAWNPPNPWAAAEIEWDDGPPPARITLLEDATRDVLSRNDSPDIPFRWSVNPYRGCMHACAYCYARPTHEYLGMGAGTDFDTRIVVKRRAPELLRAAFDRPGWKGEEVAFSGGTDAWQPIEAELRLTRGCLEVCAAYRNPIRVVTKSALLERDLDLLQELARSSRVLVSVSLPFLDPALARALEPWAPSPARRLRLIERLARAGLSPGVLVAPAIPGLDDEVPRVLAAAREAGAERAAWVLLRLPGSVAPVFEQRLRAALPEAAARVMHLVRETREGRAYDGAFSTRRRGTGAYAALVAQVFARHASRLGLDRPEPGLDGPSPFRRPGTGGQLGLFDPT